MGSPHHSPGEGSGRSGRRFVRCDTAETLMRARLLFTLSILVPLSGAASGVHIRLYSRRRTVRRGRAAVVNIDSGQPQCKVDVDGTPEGMTDSAGMLTLQGIEPGDHYLHIQCAGRREVTSFITPRPGEKLNIQPATGTRLSARDSALDASQRIARLRHIVQQAVQLRASGNFQDTLRLLREATVLDPRNSDLHRELGITFLLAQDWERARVEMLEAVHLDPGSAEARSGLAYACEKLGDLDEALKEYRICTRLDSTDASCQQHYLEVLAKIAGRKAQRKH